MLINYRCPKCKGKFSSYQPSLNPVCPKCGMGLIVLTTHRPAPKIKKSKNKDIGENPYL